MASFSILFYKIKLLAIILLLSIALQQHEIGSSIKGIFSGHHKSSESITPPNQTGSGGSTSLLSPSQIAAYKPYTYYAAAAYCNPTQTRVWKCGAHCAANSRFQPVASGGDGSNVQFWYVGYDQSLKTVIVAHQGTNPYKIKAWMTDFNFKREPLNPSLFPGMSSEILVHSGFASEHAKTAPVVIEAVKTALKKSGYNQVTLVGHSLGAAVALLDSIYLPLHLPNVHFQMYGYGLPRVGNKAFAMYVDNKISLNHVNNRRDFVPNLPPMKSGYEQPHGEKHILTDGSWVNCPGDDNTDAKCSSGFNLLRVFSDISDHLGPYDGVTMGSEGCK